MSEFDVINRFSAPSKPLYVCADDEGHHFVYVGEDTFSRLPDGPERAHWYEKVLAGKVVVHEVAGSVITDVVTGHTTLNLSDGWEID